MTAMAFQITGALIVRSTVCSGADQRKHQSPASLAYVRGIQRSPVNFPHKGPVTRKMFPFLRHHGYIITYLVIMQHIEFRKLFVIYKIIRQGYITLVYSPHKGPVTRNMFPFYDAIISRRTLYIGQIMKSRLSCYLVLLSVGRKSQ